MSLDDWLKKAKSDGVIKDAPSNKNPKEENKMEVKKMGSSPIGKQAVDILPRTEPWKARFIGDRKKKKLVVQAFRDMFPCVNEWLEGKPKGTAKCYGLYLLNFCRQANILPDEFGKLSHNKEEMEKARDIAWDTIKRKKGCTAVGMMKSVKSFFRYYTKGYQLPFDCQKGGHHRLNIKSTDKREKFVWGTMEQARERVYGIINEAGLKYRAIFVMDLVTGLRINSFLSLKWKHLKDIIEINGQEVVVIRVTPRIDQKLDSAGIEFYYAFLTKHALRTLRRYEAKFRGNATNEDLVFPSPLGGPMNSTSINLAWKRAIRRAEEKGLMPGGAHKKLWFHRIRALFKKFVRNSPIDDDEFKEFLMGHTLRAAREAYSERDPLELAREYVKINFEPPIAYLKEQHRKLLEEKQRLEAGPKEADFSVRETLEAEIDEETQGQGWQSPQMETPMPPTTEIPMYPHEKKLAQEMRDEIPKPTATVETASEKAPERILKPAPKHCLRNKTFERGATDEYCHSLCVVQSPSEYKACQELREEQPDLFA